jgi:hypothetical protein
MSAQEIMQLIYFMRIQITAHEDAMWQGEAGFLDEQARETTFLTTRRLLGNPVLRAIWHIVRGQCAPNVRAHIEKLESESPLLPPHDWARVWKTAYDKVKAEHA